MPKGDGRQVGDLVNDRERGLCPRASVQIEKQVHRLSSVLTEWVRRWIVLGLGAVRCMQVQEE